MSWQAMAARLQAHLAAGKAPGTSKELLVFNRTAAVADEFAASNPGCRAVGSVAELAEAAVVFSMVANDAAADAVWADYK